MWSPFLPVGRFAFTPMRLSNSMPSTDVSLKIPDSSRIHSVFETFSEIIIPVKSEQLQLSMDIQQ
jgi:hypothetical protein